MEKEINEGLKIEGRNAVLEAFRSEKTIDKLFVLDGCKDGPIQSIMREARKNDTIVNFVTKERYLISEDYQEEFYPIVIASKDEYAIYFFHRTF